jgi:hypothetical protein
MAASSYRKPASASTSLDSCRDWGKNSLEMFVERCRDVHVGHLLEREIGFCCLGVKNSLLVIVLDIGTPCILFHTVGCLSRKFSIHDFIQMAVRQNFPK